MGLAKTFNEQIFRQIHHNKLVYNTCWEDPRCDRALLGLDASSNVVMLTSAGCNALDYLLDQPASIHCVDVNPRQNALLELKCALFVAGDYQALFDFFGNGAHRQARRHYKQQLRSLLHNVETRRYWDRRIDYFSGTGLRPSFYWRGSSGAIAWAIRQWLARDAGMYQSVIELFEARDIQTQKAVYSRLEPKLLNRFVRWLVSRHLVQSMVGVPKSQQHLAAQYFPEGMAGYVRYCFEKVFASTPLQDNYFWKLYFFGKYSPDCCPNYLRAEHFETLREGVRRIRTHTRTLSDFLLENPGAYSHFVLLDHQDWLATHLRPALDEEWRLILANAAPGARILLRSAAFEPEFFPPFILERVVFDRVRAAEQHAVDRVGTYGSTWIGTIIS